MLSKQKNDWIVQLGTIMATNHTIYKTEETVPIRQQIYRAWQSSWKVPHEHTDMRLDAGRVRPSHSKWTSLVALVPKKSTFWFLVEYWLLNTALPPYTCPLLSTDNFIDSLREAQVFTALDSLYNIGKFHEKISIRRIQHVLLTLKPIATLAFHLVTHLLRFNMRWTLLYLESDRRHILFIEMTLSSY